MTGKGAKPAAGESKPLYRRIQDQLREKLDNREWVANQPLPTRRALSKSLGVTRITLDKAMGELIREGRLYATVGSGTYVSGPEQTAPGRPSMRRLGVAFGSDTYPQDQTECADENDYFSQVLSGVRRVAMERDVEIRYQSVGTDFARLLDTDIDGWILLAPNSNDVKHIRHLMGKVPFVVVGVSVDEAPLSETVPSVGSDGRLGGRIATEHLIELGHRDIGIIDLCFDHADLYSRYLGYVDAMSYASLRSDLRNIVLFTVYHEDWWPRRLDEWLTSGLRDGTLPTAVVCCDYAMTLATINAFRRHGISIPDDISIVGYDDSAAFEVMTPPLTCVRSPKFSLGRRAAERLLAMIDEGQGTDHDGIELHAPELIVRGSTWRFLST